MCLFINATAALRLATETVWLAGLAGQRRQRRFFAAPSILFFVFFLSGFQTCHSSNRASYKCQMIIMRRRANKLQRIVGVVEKGNRRFFWTVNLFFLTCRQLLTHFYLNQMTNSCVTHVGTSIRNKVKVIHVVERTSIFPFFIAANQVNGASVLTSLML